MLSALYSISALLVSFGILCMGHGLQNTLLGVRASLENYPEWVPGMMTSGYFLGFFLGTSLCARLIPKVGQIRTFAAFASIASAISLLHLLMLHPITWILLRTLYGVCMAALYMVIESWLNSLATQQNRARIFSIYMISNFLCMALGQALLPLANPGGFVLFVIVSVLISLSLVPITISKAEQPQTISNEHFGVKRLFHTSPLATIGCFLTGMGQGAFWGLAPVYLTELGMGFDHIALALSVSFIGGLLFQWPLGWLSDKFDRRIVLTTVFGGSVLVCLLFTQVIGVEHVALDLRLVLLMFLFGGFGYTLYSLCIALANDFLDIKHLVKASGGLILLHAMGSVVGPILAAGVMMGYGANGLFLFVGTVNTIAFCFAITRIIYGRAIPKSTSEAFISLPRTGVGILGMISKNRTQP